MSKYLFMGGPKDGQFLTVPKGELSWLVRHPSDPKTWTFLSDISDTTHMYIHTWVKFPGWKVFVRVYIVSGETIQSLPFPRGYVFPGGVTGLERDGDSWPIWPMSMARSLYLEKEHDRKLDEHLDELRRNRDV